MSWKDISSYSRNDTKREPCTFELIAEGVRLTVTRHIHYGPHDWIAIAEPYFSTVVLRSQDIVGAKEEAKKLLRNCLTKSLRALDAE